MIGKRQYINYDEKTAYNDFNINMDSSRNDFIQEFEILGLFGYKDICIHFKNSTLIVIGENGIGKTTILNALNYVLTGSYKSLLDIKFNSLRIRINNEDFLLERDTVEKYADYLRRKQEGDSTNIIELILLNVKKDQLDKMIDFLDKSEKEDLYNIINNDDFLKTFPENLIYQTLFTWNAQNKSFAGIRKLESIINKNEYSVLYYPTYRRVEVGYKRLFNSENKIILEQVEEDKISNSSEMNIRFGMYDVNNKIQKITDVIRKTSLEGFANVSGDVILKLLDSTHTNKPNLDCSYEELCVVLNRAGNKLKNIDKDTILRRFKEHDRELFDNTILLFYLDQLLRVYRSQERYEKAILKFRDVCNKYLNDKQFVYDASNVTLQIYRNVKGETLSGSEYKVSLEDLSSGEKQIVSIFSQIYLDLDKSYIILFDEPELSLSIYWQENLIPDILKSGNCKFLLAMTHSPFIFSDHLKQYTIGMTEFLKK